MFRMTLLCLAAVGFGQVIPQGCPLLAPPTEPELTERGTIDTQAMAPESAGVGETVPLTATAAVDVDGGAPAYSWLQVAGSGVKISNAGQADASFQAPSLPSEETLGFLVTTTNERGDAGRAQVQVLVQADPDYDANSQSGGSSSGPVARAGADRSTPGGSSDTLDGSNSRGDGLTYRWRQVAGQTVNLADADTVRATFEAPAYDATAVNGLEFELEVRDSRGRRSTDRIAITITEPPNTDPRPRLRFTTSLGSFTVELDRENAPGTVANFLEYVQDDFYDGTIFHRVVADFVIQGGGYEPGLVQKEVGSPIESEADNGLENLRGTIGMARRSDSDSATSQFYINLADNPNLNHTADEPGYTVFGRVTEGMSVVDAIGAVETGPREGFNDVPLEDVVIQSVEILR